jgi:hypothetical protein
VAVASLCLACATPAAGERYPGPRADRSLIVAWPGVAGRGRAWPGVAERGLAWPSVAGRGWRGRFARRRVILPAMIAIGPRQRGAGQRAHG